MNWKKILPRREIGFFLHRGFNKKHKGEYVVNEEKVVCGILQRINKTQFFKTKTEAISYITRRLETDVWIED
jgi:hypothetical protein